MVAGVAGYVLLLPPVAHLLLYLEIECPVVAQHPRCRSMDLASVGAHCGYLPSPMYVWTCRVDEEVVDEWATLGMKM